jgi:hypothetical protein
VAVLWDVCLVVTASCPSFGTRTPYLSGHRAVWYEKGCDDPRIQLLIRSNVTAGNTFKNVKEDGRASDERA